MGDIEAIARRIFEAYARHLALSLDWDTHPDKDMLDASGLSRPWPIPPRDTFRLMAGASLPPITGTLELTQDEQVMS